MGHISSVVSIQEEYCSLVIQSPSPSFPLDSPRSKPPEIPAEGGLEPIDQDCLMPGKSQSNNNIVFVTSSSHKHLCSCTVLTQCFVSVCACSQNIHSQEHLFNMSFLHAFGPYQQLLLCCCHQEANKSHSRMILKQIKQYITHYFLYAAPFFFNLTLVPINIACQLYHLYFSSHSIGSGVYPLIGCNAEADLCYMSNFRVDIDPQSQLVNILPLEGLPHVLFAIKLHYVQFSMYSDLSIHSYGMTNHSRRNYLNLSIANEE